MKGIERRAGGLCEAVLVRAFKRRLAVVADSQPLAGEVKAVVGFVADQYHARAAVQMSIVGDVDQQLLTDLILHPGVENGNQRIEVHILRLLQKKLHIDVLQFHRS